MAGVEDLRSRGLVHDIGSIGHAMSQYEDISEMGESNLSMRMSDMGNFERLELNPHLVPLVFAYKDYSFDLSELEAARYDGRSLDLTHAVAAQRSVAYDMERLLFNGSTQFTADGVPLYGYTTQPQRAIGTVPVWTTPGNVFDGVSTIYGALIDRDRPGPFGVYMSRNLWRLAHQKVGVDNAQTALAQVMPNFPDIVVWRRTFALPDNTIVMVELDSQTVDLAVRLDVTNIPWGPMAPLRQNVRVIGSTVGRIKFQQDGRLGVAHYTTA